MSPTPNTTFFRDAARCGHFRQPPARASTSAMAACLASRPADAFARGMGTPGSKTTGADKMAGDENGVAGGVAAVEWPAALAGAGGAGEGLGTACARSIG